MITKIMEQPRQTMMKFGYAGVIFFSLKGICWLLLPVFFTWYW